MRVEAIANEGPVQRGRRGGVYAAVTGAKPGEFQWGRAAHAEGESQRRFCEHRATPSGRLELNRTGAGTDGDVAL